MWKVSYVTLVAAAAVIAQPASVFAQSVEIEVNDTASDLDDFICWSPRPARVRIVGGTTGQAVTVKIGGEGAAGAGAVAFQSSAQKPTAATFSPSPTIDIAVSSDGSWTPFWIAGTKASKDGKDVSVVATEADGTELARLPVMVRVRKDARVLTPFERTLFLQAVRTLHDLDNGALASNFVKYAYAHNEAFDVGIHHGSAPTYWPLFLAWHRAFLLGFEQELQRIDPRVALPYWRFDLPDPGDVGGGTPVVFTPDFMGSVQGGAGAPGGFLVQFAPSNPLFGWQVPGLAALVRTADGTGAAMPEGRLQDIFDAKDVFGQPINAVYRGVNGAIELRYHNGAHSAIGGWLGQGYSPTDPLFFLLHANVDRGWAHWQAVTPAVRFDPSSTDAYHARGVYPGPGVAGRFQLGSYADDAMWPWTGVGGDQGTSDQNDDWPVIDQPFPLASSSGAPIKPADMVDYLETRGAGLGVHACYDDIGFDGKPIATH